MVPARVGIIARQDTEPLISHLMLSASRLQGQSATPSAEMMSEARRRFAEDLDAQISEDHERVRSSITRTLPAGVTIERLVRERAGSVVASSLFLALDDLEKLPMIRVAFEPGLTRQMPFAEMRVVAEGDSIVLEGMPPSIELSPELVRAGGAAEQSLSFILDVPRVVLESRGAQVAADGSLSWTFDLARLAERTREDAGWIFARYAKEGRRQVHWS